MGNLPYGRLGNLPYGRVGRLGNLPYGKVGPHGGQGPAGRDEIVAAGARLLPGNLLVAEQRRFDVERAKLGFHVNDRFDRGRPFPGDAGVGVFLVEVGENEVLTLGDADLRLPLRLAFDDEDLAEEDTRMFVRFEAHQLDRGTVAGPRGERNGVELRGGVGVSVGAGGCVGSATEPRRVGRAVACIIAAAVISTGSTVGR